MKHLIKSLIDHFVVKIDKTVSDSWDSKLAEFQHIIDYKFKNVILLKNGLTHDSYFKKEERNNNLSPFERMEFLGDSVLGLVVAQYLFVKFPNKQEGNLSKLKSKIVSEKFLTLRANEITLGEYILLSPEEARSGGRLKPSIVSDTMESLICAIYLDGGIGSARKFIKKFIILNFENYVNREELTNYKSILQEYTQGKYQKPPIYKLVGENGPDHQKLFTFKVEINGVTYGSGSGVNKKSAQQKAAKASCEDLNIK
ncbi:MAG: ribonuclease III [Candidatus Cloacimonetes bacterium 4572_65]|nr:MAG: ribonuclease III [Candidatus Cloacimonetes bacterium 4572_65]